MRNTESSRKLPRRKLKREHDEAKTRTITNTGYISTFLLLISAFLIYDVIVISNVQDETSTDFQALKSELENNVHRQHEAVTTILENLTKIQRGAQTVSIVNFIGSTGVGKTFIANIIKRHFSSSYESRGSLKLKSVDNVWSTIRGSSARYNLVVFDDLTVDDVDDLVVLIGGMPQDVVTLVICVFNIQETDSFLNYRINYDYIDTIESKFKAAEISQEMVTFQEFNTGEVHSWIVAQLMMRGIDEQFHAKIVESALGSHNVKYFGLKGLSSKLNLVL